MNIVHKDTPSNQNQTGKATSSKSEAETSKSAVGLMLKKTRLKHNLTLQDVSNYLNIRRGQLESIEEGRFDELPATAYAMGFIKSYADYLGLDKDLMVSRFKQETGKQIQKIDLDVPLPLSESRLPDQRIIMASIAATVAFTVLMFWVFSGDTETQENVTAVPNIEDVFEQDVASQVGTTEQNPSALAKPADANTSADPSTPVAQNGTMPPADQLQSAVPATDGTQVPATITSETSVPSEAAPGTEGTVAPTADATATTGETAPAVVVVPTTDGTDPAKTVAEGETAPTDNTLLNAENRATVYGSGNVNSRISIKARQNSWIEIRDNKNAILLSRVLKPDDVYYVPDNMKTFLTTGNAGGLDVYIDNKFAGVAGKAGEVLRQYQITAEGLIAP